MIIKRDLCDFDGCSLVAKYFFLDHFTVAEAAFGDRDNPVVKRCKKHRLTARRYRRLSNEEYRVYIMLEVLRG